MRSLLLLAPVVLALLSPAVARAAVGREPTPTQMALPGPGDAAAPMGGQPWIVAGMGRPGGHQPQESSQLRQDRADQLLEQGLNFYNRGNFAAAVPPWREALRIYRQRGDRRREMMVLLVLGDLYGNLDNYPQAVSFLEQALALGRELRDRNTQSLALAELGWFYILLEEYPLSLEASQQALALQEDSEHPVVLANIHNNLGIAYGALGNYATAIAHYEQALPLFTAIEDQTGQANVLTNLGNAYHGLSQYQRAIPYYEQALSRFTEIQDESGQGQVLMNLGITYDFLGEYERAIAYYNQALPRFERSGNHRSQAQVLANLGETHQFLSRYPEAIAAYEAALSLFTAAADRNGEALILVGMGGLYWYLGDYHEAIQSYEQALSLLAALEQHLGQAEVLQRLGVAYWSLADLPAAIDHYERALALHRTIGSRSGEAYTLNGLGYAYVDQGDVAQGMGYLEQAAALFQQIEVRHGEGYARMGLGIAAQGMGDAGAAIAHYEQALALFQTIGHREGEGKVFSHLGNLFAQQAQPELAIVFYKSAVGVWESVRGDIQTLALELQHTYTESVADIYRALADLLLQQNRILEAQRVLDLLKLQELDEALLGIQRSGQTQGGVEFWQIERELLALYAQVTADGEELTQLQAQAQAQGYDALTPAQQQRLTTLQQQAERVQDRFFDFLDQPEVVALLAQIRQSTQGQNLELEEYRTLQNNLRNLPQRTALIYPLILPDRLELVMITGEGPPLRYPIAVTGVELNRAIVAFGQALTTPISTIQPPAQQLYRWLIAPLEPQLAQAGIESIIYAPDGALRYVPLAALHDGEQYLAQRFTISHITAASLTDFDTPPQRENRRLLAGACAQCQFTVTVGNQAFAFGDLPYTEAEVITLADQVTNTHLLINQEFSLRELTPRLSGYTLLHLATHGAFIVDDPAQSFFILGSGETVSLDTIRRRWNLSHVELVVLSACETAVGSAQLGSGVEILGLGYQVQQAGAKSVLASLWQVSDQGTQVLMTAFYRGLQQGMTKTEALQAAQVALINGDIAAIAAPDLPSVTHPGSLSHPYYWAPFILIGNGL